MTKTSTLSNDEFVRLITDHERYSQLEVYTVERLLEKYPYCQAFHFIYSAALKKLKSDKFDSSLQKSAAYSPSREVLFRFLEKPQELEHLFFRKEAQNPKAFLTGNQEEFADQESSKKLGESITEEPVVDRESADKEEFIAADISETPEQSDIVAAEYAEAGGELREEAESTGQAEQETVYEEIADMQADSAGTKLAGSFREEDFSGDFSEDQYNQTATEALSQAGAPSISDEIETVIPDFEQPDYEYEERVELNENKRSEPLAEAGADERPSILTESKEDTLIPESIAATDYFIFEKSVVDPLQADSPTERSFKLVDAGHKANEVSKYHDDTLPFTFLWWLHKTRKEHSNYQPYIVNPNLVSLSPPVEAELNQQILENIFHQQPELNSLPGALPEAVPVVEVKKREDDLIERFIKEEPQIKPPIADRIDTENKARKSSEDHLDLVSETLAKIYIDQMLYHKAIDTYKKLSLKFPEKSTYFAGQIEDLQKKIS